MNTRAAELGMTSTHFSMPAALTRKATSRQPGMWPS